MAKLDAKLQNQNFITRAPEHVIEEQRERWSECKDTWERLSAAMSRLG